MPPTNPATERRSSRIRERVAQGVRRSRSRAPSRPRTPTTSALDVNQLPAQVYNSNANMNLNVNNNSNSNASMNLSLNDNSNSDANMNLSVNDSRTSNLNVNDILNTVNTLASSVMNMQQQLSLVTNMIQNKTVPVSIHSDLQPTDHSLNTAMAIDSNISMMNINQESRGQTNQSQRDVSRNGRHVPVSTSVFSSSGNPVTQTQTSTDANRYGMPLSTPSSSSHGNPVAPAQVLGTDTGGTLPNFLLNTDNCNINNSQIFQNTLPLGSNVSDAIKAKIWGNEYIDLATLLPKPPKKSSCTPIVLKHDPNSLGTHLALQENTREIKTMDQWISAFHIFGAIYCEKYKDAGPALFKYMSIVRELAHKNGDWLEYDKNFRQTKCQFRVTWASMHHELWLMNILKEGENFATQNGNTQTYMYNNTSTNYVRGNNYVPLIPNGYCIRFHQGFTCHLPCRFNHKCFKCNKLHPASRCWQQVNLNQNMNQLNYRAENFRPSGNFRPPASQRFSSSNSSPRFQRPQFRNPNSVPRFRRY